MALHVTPVNDLREHVNHGTDCWCKPEIDTTDDGELLVIHNALGQREKYETRELKPQ